ncbi:MAG: sensor domain-containing diguanylate cyclase [Anaerolineales bacterium]|nr:sensor domain-containing diguanylate cyclase [Anaerolineales bacterium]
MDQTISHILEQLNQVLPYDSASVQLFKGNELQIVGGRGWKNEQEVIGLRFPIPGDNPNSIVIETGKPYYLADVGQKYPAFQLPPANGIVSWLGVPLIVQNKIIGLLSIDSMQPNRFTGEDINVATEFANQVGIALENARIYEETQTLAITDTLTGIYNRRGLFQLGEFEFQRARRTQRPFCAMMLDIDHFKRINDQHSHAVGDQILQRFAERCQKNLRTIDLFGRYGGEEFIMLLPETNLEVAQVIANRLHQSIIRSPYSSDVGDLRITASIGVVEAHPNESLERLIERADAALYKAKNKGRNCIVIDE